MNEHQLVKIKDRIREKAGINVEGEIGPASPRKSLLFWFDNFNRGNGPVFSIRPSGLKRHIILLEFGPYAADCIEHIKTRSTQESYAIAYAFVDQLAEQFDVKLNDNPIKSNWQIDTFFNIEITRTNLKQDDFECISDSVELAMVPLMAAIAELIGYEEVGQEDGDKEGELKQSLITKRERSPRNRLLCLSIHGAICCVCKLDPESIYSSGLGSIIEIHHIEPLSEIEQARIYNPRTDLVPLCPNCHRAIHKRKPAYKPNELKDMLIK